MQYARYARIVHLGDLLRASRFQHRKQPALYITACWIGYLQSQQGLCWVRATTQEVLALEQRVQKTIARAIKRAQQHLAQALASVLLGVGVG